MKRITQFLGETYLLGSAALAFLLMLMSIARVPWSRGVLIVGVIAILAAAVIAFRRNAPFAWPQFEVANAIDVITLILIAGYVRVTTLAAPAEADFYAIWGVKAKQFFRTGGIDWKFMLDPLNVPLHMDYPLLLPLLYDVQALLAGAWPDERWFSLIHIFAALAAWLVIRAQLADEMTKLQRAAATLIVMPLIFSPFFGLPEGLLVAYGTVGLLFLRRAVRDHAPSLAMRGAIYLGLAASCKNEGVSLLVAAAIALLVTRPRFILRLWPALAIVLPWMLVRSFYALPTDIMKTGMFDRLAARLSDPAAFVLAFRNASYGSPLFWIAIAIALAIGARRLLRQERFLFIAIAAQIVFFLAVYVVTPNDLAWHVRTSAERILRQLMPAIALLALLITVIRFRAENANAIDP